MYDTSSKTKERIIGRLDDLPDEALAEVLAFVERLAADYTPRPIQAPQFKPTPIGGLPICANISLEDIADLRRELMEEFERKWLDFS